MELMDILPAVWQWLITAACFVLAFACYKTLRQIDDVLDALGSVAKVVNENEQAAQAEINDLRNYITEVENDFRNRFEAINDKYESAEEMIKQVRRAAAEAELTEKKMQDGISEILNYSGIEKVQDAFNLR